MGQRRKKKLEEALNSFMEEDKDITREEAAEEQEPAQTMKKQQEKKHPEELQEINQSIEEKGGKKMTADKEENFEYKESFNPQSETTIQHQHKHDEPEPDYNHNKEIKQTVEDLKKKIHSKSKKKKLRDIRKQRAYYLTDEEIKMIEDMANKTGEEKYQIVAKAVRFLYSELFH